MGLYFQRHQEVPAKLQFCPARSLCNNDDSSFYGCIRQIADPDLPPSRSTCHGNESCRRIHLFIADITQGGMAAQIPIKDDKKANDAAMNSVYEDKLREVRAGHDGTWVAHPALAIIATEVFNKHMPTPNQLWNRREDVHVTANDLLNMDVPGTITEAGIRKNLNIGLGYMEGWLKGVGCVPINYLMVGAGA